MKTLVIGLELGSGLHLGKWAEAGFLPNLSRLLSLGKFLELKTNADQLHVSAWPTLYTGVGPGEHGVYFTFQPASGIQGYQRFFDGIYGCPTFWSLLDENRRRCVVMDAPYTHFEAGFSGVQILDWGTWAHYLTTASQPENLIGRLDKAVGPYNLGMEAHDFGMTTLSSEDARDKLVRAAHRKGQAGAWLIQERDWDLAFIVFGETHVASHYCWRPEYNTPGDPKADQPAMRTVYEALDSAIGLILTAAGLECRVVIVSGDGVGCNHAGWHLLPEIMAKLGYIVTADTAPIEGKRQSKKSMDPVRLIRDFLPKNLRKDLARLLPTTIRDKLAQRVDMANIDWNRSQVYCLPTDLEGCIRINLKGREPNGIVEPGREYEDLCKEMTNELMALENATNGGKVVREVLRTDEVFPGRRRDQLPDLIVLWNDSNPIEATRSPRSGLVQGTSPDFRPGTHKSPGFAIVSGPGMMHSTAIQHGHVRDLAPTLLSWHDVPIPSHMEGRIWAY